MESDLHSELREAVLVRTLVMDGPPDGVKRRLDYMREALACAARVVPPSGAALVVGGLAGNTCHHLSGVTTIGSGTDSDVRLEGSFISRRHCSIRSIEGDWLIEDLESTNGVYVNGKRSLRHLLCDGDVIQVGSVTLLFLHDADSGDPELTTVGLPGDMTAEMPDSLRFGGVAGA